MNAMTSAPVTLSLLGFCLRLATTPDLPRPPSWSLLYLGAGCPRPQLGARCSTQLGEEVSDVLGQHTMLSSKRAGLLSAVLILGPQLTQPRLLSLRDRGLGDQTAENELAGRVEPVAGQRIDDFTPYALLDGIQVRRWLRTAPPWDAGDDSERGCGLAGHGRNSPSRWKLARDPKIDHVSGGGGRARRDRLGSCFFGPPPARKQRLLLPCRRLKDWLRPSCRLGLGWRADVCPTATSSPDGDKATKKQTGGLRRHG